MPLELPYLGTLLTSCVCVCLHTLNEEHNRQVVDDDDMSLSESLHCSCCDSRGKSCRCAFPGHFIHIHRAAPLRQSLSIICSSSPPLYTNCAWGVKPLPPQIPIYYSQLFHYQCKGTPPTLLIDTEDDVITSKL